MIGKADERAERLGLVLSEDAIKQGDRLGDTWDRLVMAGKSLLATVITPFAPLLNGIATAAIWVGNQFAAMWNKFGPFARWTAAMERMKNDPHFGWLFDTKKPETPNAPAMFGSLPDPESVIGGVSPGEIDLFIKQTDRLAVSLGKTATTWNAFADGALRAAEAMRYASSTVPDTPPAGYFTYSNIGRPAGQVPIDLPAWSGQSYGNLNTPPPGWTAGFEVGGGIPSQFTRPDLMNTPPGGASWLESAFASLPGAILGAVVRPVAWEPLGTDTVPAMLTPGEGVLSRRGMNALGALNRGEVPVIGGGDRALLEEVKGLRGDMRSLRTALPNAVRDTMLLAGGGRR